MTMYPYVALLQRRSLEQIDGRFRRVNPTWRSIPSGPGVRAYHLPGRVKSMTLHTLPGGRGFVVGTLFESRRTRWRAEALDSNDELAAEIVSSRGAVLRDEFWGSYVAVLNDAARVIYVLRDCSARLPCYLVRSRDLLAVTSDIGLLAGMQLPPFTLNRRYIAGFLFEPELSQRESGLLEVAEVLGGDCVELREDSVMTRSLWDPRAVAANGAVESFGEAAARVRDVTQDCVDRWASKFERIEHRLSGGLDSSVVLGTLMRTAKRPEVTCVHWESGERDDRDREYARLAASRADVELLIRPAYTTESAYDERVFRLPQAPKPSFSTLALTLDSPARVASQTIADAVWDGQGGDHLFLGVPTALGAVDHAYRHRGGHELAESVRDSARRSRLSYWGVIGRVIRLGLIRGAWRPEDEYPRRPVLINEEFLLDELISYVWAPWDENTFQLPPGKRWQICLLGYVLHRHRPVPELQTVAEYHPLMSQPLIELCLQIPTYILLHGGRDRALERVAFADRIPEEVARREQKGAVNIALAARITANMPFLRSLLADGILVRERLVDAAALRPYLSGRPLDQASAWPFMSALTAEIWARKWAQTGWRIAEPNSSSVV